MFKIGDRVVINKNYPLYDEDPNDVDINIRGFQGVIINKINNDSPFYGQYEIKFKTIGIGIFHKEEIDLVE